jgi:hypothetical protein
MAWSDAARAAALQARRSSRGALALHKHALSSSVRKLYAKSIRAMRAGTKPYNSLTIEMARMSTNSRNARRRGKKYIARGY